MLAVALLASPAFADPLDDAVALVLAAHPVLVAERGVRSAEARQRDWKTDLNLSWTQQGTEYGGTSGPNLGVRMSIPLFDRSREQREAKAAADLRKSEQTVLEAFLADVARLGEAAAKVRERERMRAFYRDRLEYRSEQVDEGMAEAGTLWAEAEQVQTADLDFRRESESLAAALEAAARRHGGEEWMRLRDLLAEITNSRRQ